MQQPDKIIPGNQAESTEKRKLKAVSDLSDEEWQIAAKRYHIIAPIINNEADVSIERIAKDANIGRATIFRWLQRYRQTESLSALVQGENPRSTGQTRLSPEIEAIITTVIEKRFLNGQKLNVKKIAIDIALDCRTAGLNTPHYLTIRSRVNKLDEALKMARRQDKSVADNIYKPLEGSFPEATYPLEAIQIDHTPLDIIVVDEVYRMPVGKPWITVAIDVYSRMIIGFYISLDPPGALGTGLCLSHAILEKDLWLSALDVPGKWPCFGLIKSLYIDNAREFNGKMLERAAQEYGIEINFRPVATPNYGGHIERLLGTVLREIHTLPGTTFSNTKDRKHYDSEGKACMTLKELEKWLATFIVGVYHQRKHTGINTTPFARYNESILGDGQQIGIGRSRPIQDTLKLKLDFMPFVERTVQRYGISIDGIMYYGNVLRKWIHAYQSPNARYKSLKKFAIKRDPRDISMVYFYDPELKDYFDLPYRNTSHPSITIWEHREIMRSLKEKGMKHVDEDAIFDAYAKMRHIEETATGNAAAARRLRNKTRKQYATTGSIKNQYIQEHTEEELEAPPKLDFTKKYLPFEDIEG